MCARGGGGSNAAFNCFKFRGTLPISNRIVAPMVPWSELVLDPRIRDFVLLPIVVLMLLTNIFRHYLMLYIGNPEKKSDLKSIYAA